jgi:acetolactate decarboxylase
MQRPSHFENDEPMMHQLKTKISRGLWRALENHAERSREPLAHIVSKALSEYLQVSHHTLYQVSTSTALVKGIYQGAVRVGTLKEHGDLGLGTFENLDGEMVVVDGHFFQVRSDGTVRECSDDVLSPFAVVTQFEPDKSITLDNCPDMGYLTSAFDGLRHSGNVFFALRVYGHFAYIHTRAMCRSEEGVPLVQAAAIQPEFEFHDIDGTLVGFWTPDYAKTLNVPGYHLHFLSADRKNGGHLLQCRGANLSLHLQRETVIALALPETEDFLNADLHKDPTADLARAEGEKK